MTEKAVIISKISSPKTKKESYWNHQEKTNLITAILFLLPNTIGFLSFTLIPVVISLSISFFDWELIGDPVFVGLKNYYNLLFADVIFGKVILNTLYYVVAYVSLNVVIAMSLALWLSKDRRFILFFRSVFFLPQVMPIVAIALIWKMLYLPKYGLINQFLSLFGSPDINWLFDPNYAMLAIIITSGWLGFGYNMVIFIAGIKGIPSSMFEAAWIDGANKWNCFWRITLPLLSPSVFYAVVMTIISSFQVFDQTMIMTGGSPANSTNTIVLYLYQNGFQFFKMGYASAIAWVLFAFIFIVTLIQMKLQKEWVNYE